MLASPVTVLFGLSNGTKENAILNKHAFPAPAGKFSIDLEPSVTPQQVGLLTK
jgi:hypothetical protein